MLEFKSYQLTIRLDRQRLPIIREFDLKVKEGEILGILGESGSGKTMAMTSMLGLVDDQVRMQREGSVSFRGTELLKMRRGQLRNLLGREIAYVFQNALTSFNPYQTVGRQIDEVLQVNGIRKSSLQISEMLGWVGIEEAEAVKRLYPNQLSGGMAQRIYIAMMLLLEPSLIIADEPTSSVDAVFRRRILKILKDINETYGTTIILITHDFDSAAFLCDRIGVMYGGLLMELAGTDLLIDKARHPYTRALFDCVASLETPAETLYSIGGQPVGPRQYDPNQCPFAPRCERATKTCFESMPAWTEDQRQCYRCHHPLEEVTDE